MDDLLPLPKSKSGWISGFILTILLFILYYMPLIGRSLYENLRTYYVQSHVFVEFKTLIAYSDIVADSELQNVKIFVDVPVYANTIGAQPLYIRLKYQCVEENRTAGNILRDIRVSLYYEPKDSTFSHLLLLPGITAGDGAVFINSVTVDTLAPCEEYLIRMSFIPPAQDYDIGNLRLLLSDAVSSQPRGPEKSSNTESNVKGAFLMILLANLLLPPWANGFIPLFALFVCYIFENDDKDFTFSKIGAVFWRALLLTIGVGIWLFGFIYTKNFLFFLMFPLTVYFVTIKIILWKTKPE